jgi:hypothetical protein
MNDDRPTGEARPLIARTAEICPKAERERRNAVLPRPRGWFGPSEPCKSLWRGGSSRSEAGKWGIPAEECDRRLTEVTDTGYVFVSYRSIERSFAIRLAGALLTDGASVWVDRFPQGISQIATMPVRWQNSLR